MFQRTRRVRSVLHFVRDRVPHYGPLVTDDLHHFRDEMVKATVGAGVSAVAGLIFACFLSLAVIVTAWESSHRILVAWLVCLAWAVLAGLVTGAAYELPMRTSESGMLRRERFSGLSTSAFVAAKAAVLVPALAVADVIILAIPGMAGRLQLGFGLSYLSVFVASAIGLSAAMATLNRTAGLTLVSS